MATQNDLNTLIRPLLDTQAELNEYVILNIATYIGECRDLTLKELNSLEHMGKYNNNIKKLLKELNRIRENQYIEFFNFFIEVAMYEYVLMLAMEEDLVPFDKNSEIKKMVNNTTKEFTSNYMRVMKSPILKLGDPKNKKIIKDYPIAKAMQIISDEVKLAKSQTILDYDTYLKPLEENILNSGVRSRVVNEDGTSTTPKIESWLATNLWDYAIKVIQNIQNIVQKQLDLKLVELSVVNDPAPDHAPIQGHQFSIEEFDKLQRGESFEDTYGLKFDPILRAIGTFHCRHIIRYQRQGTKPTYTKKALSEMNKKSQEIITLSNGAKLTRYEIAQRKKTLERRIKNNQLNFKFATKSKNHVLQDVYNTRISRDKNELNYLKRLKL